MSRWVRLWEDMPTDPKWRVIARRSGRPVTEVIAVFVLMMTSAEASTGSLDGFDDEDAAAALDMDAEAVMAIRKAMDGKTVDGGRLSGWEKRQPKRHDDTSTDRVRAFRERKRADETLMKRTETNCNAPEEIREETEQKEKNYTPSALSELQSVLSEESAKAVIEHRSKMKAPLTQRAAKALAKRFAESGNPERAVETMLARGWRSYEPTWAGASQPATRETNLPLPTWRPNRGTG